MKSSNKLQTLLTDLRDKIQHRQYHVKCLHCRWEVRNLDHRRFALARGRMHVNNHHQTQQLVNALSGDMSAMAEVWHSRA